MFMLDRVMLCVAQTAVHVDTLTTRLSRTKGAGMRMDLARLTFGIVAVAGTAMTAACGSSTSPTPTPTPTPPPTSGPTFSQQIQAQILTPACVFCHTDEGR